ncbi:MAG: hypothetical protein DI525_03980 [Corynebacterium kroppenstedtii]|uniref:Uncharacterized protein n=1 Tax=Corynebacterium kroppenstedtii TaxID=161879 RepID=A0A2W5SQF4_9CORY|nr:MAG: hypothetical protein DI525_03980 [Corynebacterium kroppenstedtii]
MGCALSPLGHDERGPLWVAERLPAEVFCLVACVGWGACSLNSPFELSSIPRQYDKYLVLTTGCHKSPMKQKELSLVSSRTKQSVEPQVADRMNRQGAYFVLIKGRW